MGNNHSRHVLRSIGAVFAGFLAVVIPSIATDTVLHATGIFPPMGQSMSNGLYLLALAYRLAYGVAGGYVTAWLAPDRPMRHALVLGAIGFVLSIAGAAAMWDVGPAWFPLAIIATAIPSAWAGAKLRGLK